MNRTSWIFIVTTMLICFCIGLFFFRPNTLSAWKTYKEIQTTKNDLAQTSKKQEVLTALSKNSQLINIYDIASKYIPESDNSGKLTVDLSTMASQSNLKVDQLAFNDASTTDISAGVKELTFSITISGTFPNFLNFLKSTETSSRLITFTKMNFSRSDTAFMAQLSGTSYWKKGSTLETTLDNITISQSTIDKFQNLKSYGAPIDSSTESGFGRTNPFDAIE